LGSLALLGKRLTSSPSTNPLAFVELAHLLGHGLASAAARGMRE
jgi:hypothetical protein